jgi:hypothetical protein
MITTNFAKQKFLECDYRIQHDIRDCTECNIAFECEEHDNSFHDWNFESQPFMKDELFETIGRLLEPINLLITYGLPR